MKRRKRVAFINVCFFGLFATAFLLKMMLPALILLIIFAGVFVFTVQS